MDTQTDKTQESLFTLVSLYVLTKQHLNALLFHNKFYTALLNQVSDNELYDDRWVIDNTIEESLVHQIILKSCAFVDEWHKHLLGHEPEFDTEKIFLLKKVAKPAFQHLKKQVTEFRSYRNEAIAHNHRDNNGNIYLNRKNYSTPDSISEVKLIVFYMDSCVHPIREIFPLELGSILNSLSLLHSKALNPTKPKMSDEEIERMVREIDEQVRLNLKNEIAKLKKDE